MFGTQQLIPAWADMSLEILLLKSSIPNVKWVQPLADATYIDWLVE